MALSNNGVSSVQSDSGAGVLMQSGSPVRSSVAGFTTFSSIGQDVRVGRNLQQQCGHVSRTPLNLELPHRQQQASAGEGSKEATTHDFLSLCGNKSDGQVVPTSRGTIPCVTTLDFLHPLEKGGKSTSGNPSTQALATTAGLSNRLRTGSTADNYGGSQETSYGLVKGALEPPLDAIFRMEAGEKSVDGARERLENLAYWPTVQLKFGSAESGFLPKTTSHGQLEFGQHASALNKQWQQSGSELFEVPKKPPRVPSEDDEDEDDDYADRGRDQRKNNLFQRGDTLQKLDGRGNDNKGNTPRSKHSATEQRRRSKINDRFQMLRQLVPNHDQKRDKASFLLEVIEYIQSLQEQVRKFETAEHGRQQERLKSIPWDVGQRSTGVRDSTAESSHIDSLPYRNEHIPIVSTVPFDLKQPSVANGLMRQKLTPVAISSAREVSATELLSSMGHVSMHLDRTVQAPQCRLSSFDNKAIITKPSPITLPAQPSTHSSYGRSSAYIFHSFPHTASEMQAMASHLSQEEPALPPISNSTVPLYKVEAVNVSHLHGSSTPPVQSTNNVDNQKQREVNIRKPDPGQQHAINGQSSEEQATAKSDLVPELQVSGASSSRQVPNGDATSGTSSDTNDAHKTESENNVQVQADEQEPLAIHGGVINVSSIYSQGLLDTLTRALQSSGLDLSQASISVQIKLGKQSAAVATTTQKVTPLPSEVSQLSQVPGRQPGVMSGLEPPSKRPKIEVDNSGSNKVSHICESKHVHYKHLKDKRLEFSCIAGAK